jgi:predicted acyl esterase
MSSLEGEAPMAAVARDRKSQHKTHQRRSEARDGMRIDWDVPIAMGDGLIPRADVFRPIAGGHYPVLLR